MVAVNVSLLQDKSLSLPGQVVWGNYSGLGCQATVLNGISFMLTNSGIAVTYKQREALNAEWAEPGETSLKIHPAYSPNQLTGYYFEARNKRLRAFLRTEWTKAVLAQHTMVSFIIVSDRINKTEDLFNTGIFAETCIKELGMPCMASPVVSNPNYFGYAVPHLNQVWVLLNTARGGKLPIAWDTMFISGYGSETLDKLKNDYGPNNIEAASAEGITRFAAQAAATSELLRPTKVSG